jgi:hypothetical protein
MLRRLFVIVCLLSLGVVMSAGCHAGAHTDKGHGASIDVG